MNGLIEALLHLYSAGSVYIAIHPQMDVDENGKYGSRFSYPSDKRSERSCFDAYRVCILDECRMAVEFILPEPFCAKGFRGFRGTRHIDLRGSLEMGLE